MKFETRIQKRMKDYRKARELTLRQIAGKVGCTASFISQVERGLTVPSLSMVGRLAAALDIPVVELFAESADGIDNDCPLRKADRKTIHYPDGKVTSQMLATRVTVRMMEPLISLIEPGGTSDVAEGMTHPGETEEFVLVLKGALDFTVGGREIRLRQGDSLGFSGARTHRWVNNGKRTAEVLFVFTPPIW